MDDFPLFPSLSSQFGVKIMEEMVENRVGKREFEANMCRLSGHPVA